MERAEKIIRELLQHTDISIDGTNPYDLQIHNDQLYARIINEGSLGLGESYMDGWWDCAELDSFFDKILRAGLQYKIKKNVRLLLQIFLSKIQNFQAMNRAKKVADVHYNLDNELYEKMLGKTMAYTCGYWKNAESLDEAQFAKFDLVCKKLQLNEKDDILELGCGWGGFAKFASENYGCKITAVNIAEEHIKYANAQKGSLPIEYFCCDYRDVKKYNPSGKNFTKVVSIGLCEHVGYKNYHTFLDIVNQQMCDDGLFLLHTIGSDFSVTMTDPWINKYIFPNGMLPSIQQLAAAFEHLFVMEDWHNFGPDYDKTLLAWHENFIQAWPKFESKYDKRFYRMWCYYLLCSAGMFRARDAQLWQVVLSKGRKGTYRSIR